MPVKVVVPTNLCGVVPRRALARGTVPPGSEIRTRNPRVRRRLAGVTQVTICRAFVILLEAEWG